MARLKVFVTRIGIRDWAVAVSSQKAALKAWDVRENLFATGAAKETQDPAAITAAMKNPGVPVPVREAILKIPEGSNVVRLPTRKREAARALPPPPPKPKRDRSKLDAAELALARYEREAKKARADMERRRRLLEDELAAEEAELQREKRALEKKVEKARRNYEDG